MIPHGVDAELFNETKQPLAEIVQWKGSLPAVLFVGELSFRKGFDLFLRATLAAARQGCVFASWSRHVQVNSSQSKAS